MDRRDRSRVALETARWLNAGCAEFPDLYVAARTAARNSVLLDPPTLGNILGTHTRRPPRGAPTVFEVTPETTLEAAARLPGAVALVFASARNPGGGALRGANGQEESVARGSGLLAVEHRHAGLYIDGEHARAPFYSHAMLYAPAVPIFRDRDDGLLPQLAYGAMIVAAAPNKSVAHRGQRAACDEVLHERARLVLAAAAGYRHATVVLGAFGCGVFGNDPAQLAAAFERLLRGGGPFEGAFDRVVFAMAADRGANWDAFRRFAADEGRK